MQTRRRRPLSSQPPLRSNSNEGNVIYRKPSVVRSRDGSSIGTIKQGTRTTVDYRKTNALKAKKTNAVNGEKVSYKNLAEILKAKKTNALKAKTKQEQSGDETEPFGISKSLGTIDLTTTSGIRKARQIGLVSKPDKFITGRMTGELNVISNQHMVNKKLVNKDGKLNPTLQGWESRNLTSGRTKRQLNQGANFGMRDYTWPIYYYESKMKRQGRV